MYSPKIREDLIPAIYLAAKRAKVPMTRWVNEVIKRALWREVNDGNCSLHQQEQCRNALTVNSPEDRGEDNGG